MTRGFEPRRQGERPTILIVEEGADSTSAPDEAFVSRGFAVLRADNTTEGLRIANRRWPDLILLDLKSAENAAAGFLRDLRMQLPTEPLPVLMITSGSDSKSRINALESGADDCLSRPFALDELFGRIEAILRRTLRQTDHRKTQANLVAYLARHYERRGYEVFSPFLPETASTPSGWVGPAPDLTIVRGTRTVAVATESVQSLLREDTPSRWIAFLENDIDGLRIFVRDRKSHHMANRIRKALRLPFQISRVRHRSQHIQSPKLHTFRLRKTQRRALTIGAVIVALSFAVGFTYPASRLRGFGTQVLTWFVMQGRHYQPKGLERQLMRQAKEKSRKVVESRRKSLGALRRQLRR